MKNIYIFLIIFCSILIIVPTITLSILSFIIGAKNINTTCDITEHTIIRLSVWLFVNSGFSLLIIMIYLILFSVFLSKQRYKYLITFIIIYILNWIFIVVWNIIGAIQLFQNSSKCREEAEPLWIITCISLIFHWIGIFQVCCMRRYDKVLEEYV